MGWSSTCWFRSRPLQQKTKLRYRATWDFCHKEKIRTMFFFSEGFVFFEEFVSLWFINKYTYIYIYICIHIDFFFGFYFFLGGGFRNWFRKIHFNHRNHGSFFISRRENDETNRSKLTLPVGTPGRRPPRQAGDSQCATVNGRNLHTKHPSTFNLRLETPDMQRLDFDSAPFPGFQNFFGGQIYLYQDIRPVTSVNGFIKLLYISRFIHPVIYPPCSNKHPLDKWFEKLQNKSWNLESIWIYPAKTNRQAVCTCKNAGTGNPFPSLWGQLGPIFLRAAFSVSFRECTCWSSIHPRRLTAWTSKSWSLVQMVFLFPGVYYILRTSR